MSDLPTFTYCCGLDLGQAQDYSALAVIVRHPWRGRTFYGVQHLQRWELGTGYPTICQQTKATLSLPPLPGSPLAVDQTGVGRPVVDVLRLLAPPVQLLPVTITGGHAVTTAEDGSLHVPKRDLVSVVRVLIDDGRFYISPALRMTRVLGQELEVFRAKISVAGNETYEAWRERDHDDLVLAVALACWAGERYPAWGNGSIGTSKRSPVAAAPAGVFRADGKPPRGVFRT